MTSGAGRLIARPDGAPRERPPEPGLHALGLGGERDGLLYVPAGYAPDRPAPLAVMLHGAGSEARPGLAPLLPMADPAGIVLLATDSRGRTWDMILGGYGADVEFLDAALASVFARMAIDPTRVALGGFSDGASYALSLALANGELFTHVLPFSPGFVHPPSLSGLPRIFVSHGRRDPVLPIERCGRRVVRELRDGGYDVEYVEFDGGHSVPDEVARHAAGLLGALPQAPPAGDA